MGRSLTLRVYFFDLIVSWSNGNVIHSAALAAGYAVKLAEGKGVRLQLQWCKFLTLMFF